MKTEIQNADYLTVYPDSYFPSTKEECLSALVGYNLGDGTVTYLKSKKHYTSSFYGDYDAMYDICRCISVVFGKSAVPRFKKGAIAKYDTWQVQLGNSATLLLIEKGCVIGKKTRQTYDLPPWIAEGSLAVKRAFVAALFGAEGSTPRVGTRKTIAMPMMSMHKNTDNCFDSFFSGLSSILSELGVTATVKKNKSITGIGYSIYVKSGIDNTINFLENCGYLFSLDKQDKCWLWLSYLKAARFDRIQKINIAKDAVSKYSFTKKAVEYSGFSRGRLFRLSKNESSSGAILHDFQSFNDWVCSRLHNGGLRLKISNKKITGKALMYNILVSSHDNSYLIGAGIDNFNSFETATGRIYEDYSKANHTTATIEPHEQLHWSHDQNFTPLSSCISVIRNEKDLYLLDEIVLTSAVSRQSALEFVDKFKDHQNKHVFVYGDPAGRAGEKHGHASDYDEIEKVLRENGWKYTRRVAKKHPAIKDRQNAVRAKTLNAAGEISLYVNIETAKWCHEGLSTVQLQKGSTFQEDQTNQYQHITTAIGYQVSWLWPIGKAAIKPQPITGMY